MVWKKTGRKIEEDFKEHFGVKHVFLVSSGKAALFVILSALKKIRNRKYVIIPAYTCYSVPSAILKAGLEIILCDINTETLDYDYEMLEKVTNEEVLCIVSTHLFGIPSNVSELKERYQGKGIFIIEDAAQAMGGVLHSRKLGTLGDAGFFSLGRGKNITTGTGGIILTSSDDIAESIQQIYRSLKREPPIEYTKNIFQVFFLHIFLNPMLYWFPSQLSFLKIGETIFHKDFPVYRLSGFKAGLLFQWESRLEKFNEHRSATSNFYIRTIQPPKNLLFYSSSYPFLRFPFYVNGPEEKAKICMDYSSFGVSPMYPSSINNMDEIKEIFDGSAYPGAEYAVNCLITLPTHCLLKVQDKLHLSDMLKSLIN